MSQSTLRSHEVLGKKLLKYAFLFAARARRFDCFSNWPCHRVVCWTVMISKLSLTEECVSSDNILWKSLTFASLLLCCNKSKPSVSCSKKLVEFFNDIERALIFAVAIILLTWVPLQKFQFLLHLYFLVKIQLPDKGL